MCSSFQRGHTVLFFIIAMMAASCIAPRVWTPGMGCEANAVLVNLRAERTDALIRGSFDGCFHAFERFGSVLGSCESVFTALGI